MSQYKIETFHPSSPTSCRLKMESPSSSAASTFPSSWSKGMTSTPNTKSVTSPPPLYFTHRDQASSSSTPQHLSSSSSSPSSPCPLPQWRYMSTPPLHCPSHRLPPLPSSSSSSRDPSSSSFSPAPLSSFILRRSARRGEGEGGGSVSVVKLFNRGGGESRERTGVSREAREVSIERESEGERKSPLSSISPSGRASVSTCNTDELRLDQKEEREEKLRGETPKHANGTSLIPKDSLYITSSSSSSQTASSLSVYTPSSSSSSSPPQTSMLNTANHEKMSARYQGQRYEEAHSFSLRKEEEEGEEGPAFRSQEGGDLGKEDQDQCNRKSSSGASRIFSSLSSSQEVKNEREEKKSFSLEMTGGDEGLGGEWRQDQLGEKTNYHSGVYTADGGELLLSIKSFSSSTSTGIGDSSRRHPNLSPTREGTFRFSPSLSSLETPHKNLPTFLQETQEGEQRERGENRSHASHSSPPVLPSLSSSLAGGLLSLTKGPQEEEPSKSSSSSSRLHSGCTDTSNMEGGAREEASRSFLLHSPASLHSEKSKDTTPPPTPLVPPTSYPSSSISPDARTPSFSSPSTFSSSPERHPSKEGEEEEDQDKSHRLLSTHSSCSSLHSSPHLEDLPDVSSKIYDHQIPSLFKKISSSSLLPPSSSSSSSSLFFSSSTSPPPPPFPLPLRPSESSLLASRQSPSPPRASPTDLSVSLSSSSPSRSSPSESLPLPPPFPSLPLTCAPAPHPRFLLLRDLQMLRLNRQLRDHSSTHPDEERSSSSSSLLQKDLRDFTGWISLPRLSSCSSSSSTTLYRGRDGKYEKNVERFGEDSLDEKGRSYYSFTTSSPHPSSPASPSKKKKNRFSSSSSASLLSQQNSFSSTSSSLLLLSQLAESRHLSRSEEYLLQSLHRVSSSSSSTLHHLLKRGGKTTDGEEKQRDSDGEEEEEQEGKIQHLHEEEEEEDEEEEVDSQEVYMSRQTLTQGREIKLAGSIQDSQDQVVPIHSQLMDQIIAGSAPRHVFEHFYSQGVPTDSSVARLLEKRRMQNTTRRLKENLEKIAREKFPQSFSTKTSPELLLELFDHLVPSSSSSSSSSHLFSASLKQSSSLLSSSPPSSSSPSSSEETFFFMPISSIFSALTPATSLSSSSFSSSSKERAKPRGSRYASQGQIGRALERLYWWPGELNEYDKKETLLSLSLSDDEAHSKILMTQDKLLPQGLSQRGWILGLHTLPFNLPDWPATMELLPPGLAEESSSSLLPFLDETSSSSSSSSSLLSQPRLLRCSPYLVSYSPQDVVWGGGAYQGKERPSSKEDENNDASHHLQASSSLSSPLQHVDRKKKKDLSSSCCPFSPPMYSCLCGALHLCRVALLICGAFGEPVGEAFPCLLLRASDRADLLEKDQSCRSAGCPCSFSLRSFSSLLSSSSSLPSAREAEEKQRTSEKGEMNERDDEENHTKKKEVKKELRFQPPLDDTHPQQANKVDMMSSARGRESHVYSTLIPSSSSSVSFLPSKSKTLKGSHSRDVSLSRKSSSSASSSSPPSKKSQKTSFPHIIASAAPLVESPYVYSEVAAISVSTSRNSPSFQPVSSAIDKESLFSSNQKGLRKYEEKTPSKLLRGGSLNHQSFTSGGGSSSKMKLMMAEGGGGRGGEKIAGGEEKNKKKTSLVPAWHLTQDILLSRLVTLEEIQAVLDVLCPAPWVLSALQFIIGVSTNALSPIEWLALLHPCSAMDISLDIDDIIRRFNLRNPVPMCLYEDILSPQLSQRSCHSLSSSEKQKRDFLSLLSSSLDTCLYTSGHSDQRNLQSTGSLLENSRSFECHYPRSSSSSHLRQEHDRIENEDKSLQHVSSSRRNRTRELHLRACLLEVSLDELKCLHQKEKAREKEDEHEKGNPAISSFSQSFSSSSSSLCEKPSPSSSSSCSSRDQESMLRCRLCGGRTAKALAEEAWRSRRRRTTARAEEAVEDCKPKGEDKKKKIKKTSSSFKKDTKNFCHERECKREGGGEKDDEEEDEEEDSTDRFETKDSRLGLRWWSFLDKDDSRQEIDREKNDKTKRRGKRHKLPPPTDFSPSQGEASAQDLSPSSFQPNEEDDDSRTPSRLLFFPSPSPLSTFSSSSSFSCSPPGNDAIQGHGVGERRKTKEESVLYHREKCVKTMRLYLENLIGNLYSSDRSRKAFDRISIAAVNPSANEPGMPLGGAEALLPLVRSGGSCCIDIYTLIAMCRLFFKIFSHSEAFSLLHRAI
ncbi:hypothetical protein CSUI_003383 [Cystoisospora suis]|uniref:Uncharacterized protein n=1 Tax=Cystoisospora suis TaxID=483139 RepID=A0A2C6L2S2_9APIC|nr:hypothetical protein CSUI_003383 [Cystoisospora suis]